MTVYTQQTHTDTIGTLMILAMFTAVATIIGLTWKPTDLVISGDYGPAGNSTNYTSSMKNATADNDSSPRLCKRCALDPKKLYGYGLGIPVGIAIALWIFLLCYRMYNPAKQKYYEMKATAKGGKLEGVDEDAYRNIQMQNMTPHNRDDIMLQQKKMMQAQLARDTEASHQQWQRQWQQRQQQYPQQQQQYPQQQQHGSSSRFGATGGGWVRGRFPRDRG